MKTIYFKKDHFHIYKSCKFFFLVFVLAYSYTPTFACFNGGSPSGTLTGPTNFCQLGVTGSTSFYTITANEWSEVIFTVSGGTIMSCTGELTFELSAVCFDDNDIGWYLGQSISPGSNSVTIGVIWTTSGSRSVNLNVYRNGFSNTEIDYSIDYPAPPQYVNISGSNELICSNTTSVSLTASGGAGGYNWTSASSSGVPLSHATTGSLVTFTNFTPNTYYSINASSNGSCGQPITGSTNIVTGLSCRPSDPGGDPSIDEALPIHILNQELTEQTKLFPNPIHQQDFVNLSIPDELHGAEIVLFDSNGQLIYSARATKGDMRLDIGVLESGMYVLMIRNETANVAKQLIVGDANGSTSINY